MNSSMCASARPARDPRAYCFLRNTKTDVKIASSCLRSMCRRLEAVHFQIDKLDLVAIPHAIVDWLHQVEAGMIDDRAHFLGREDLGAGGLPRTHHSVARARRPPRFSTRAMSPTERRAPSKPPKCSIEDSE